MACRKRYSGVPNLHQRGAHESAGDAYPTARPGCGLRGGQAGSRPHIYNDVHDAQLLLELLLRARNVTGVPLQGRRRQSRQRSFRNGTVRACLVFLTCTSLTALSPPLLKSACSCSSSSMVFTSSSGPGILYRTPEEATTDVLRQRLAFGRCDCGRMSCASPGALLEREDSLIGGVWARGQGRSAGTLGPWECGF